MEHSVIDEDGSCINHGLAELEEDNIKSVSRKQNYRECRWAVWSSNVTFSYGRGKASGVLHGTSLKVPKSSIYALLGPSGCGKTTLLKAMVGLVKLDKGELLVFDKTPGSKGSNIPGSGLGYMPQDVALYDQLTVREAQIMFAKLHSVPEDVILKRIDDLSVSLELPPPSRKISQLSGGQNRRVSLACALINNPKLLILDEPTVGVDPMLRKNIWRYLMNLTSRQGTTIIITTHYIEEAKEAHFIGMMRKGRILAEGSPTNLMQHFNTTSLESCFVKICKRDEEMVGSEKYNKNKMESPTENYGQVQIGEMCSSNLLNIDLIENEPTGNGPVKDYFSKVKALFWRNLILLKRNFLLVVFQCGLPTLQMLLFCYCVGSNLFDLPLAIVNEETPKFMSSIYLDKLDNYTLNKHQFSDLGSAIRSVESGENSGVLHISHNFTKCLFKRFQLGLKVDNYTINCSSLKAHMDNTNFMKSRTITMKFFAAYEQFFEEILYIVGGSQLLSKPGIDYSVPIHGSLDTTFTEYVLPNLTLLFAFLLSIILTCFTFIYERKSGIFDRFLVSGVKLNQILVSHLLIQSLIVCIQAALMITLPNLILGYSSKGPIILLAILTLLQGFVGMTFGLFISSVTQSENTAINITNGVLYPLSFISDGTSAQDAVTQEWNLHIDSKANCYAFFGQLKECLTG